MYKKIIGLILITAISLLLGCTQDTVKIGYVGSLSGESSELGIEGMYGALLAVEEINMAGGVQGKAHLLKKGF